MSYKCSKARVIQWMSNICKYVCTNTGLILKPGKHAAIELRDGSKMIIENAHLPLSREDLHLN
ncbi:unnamed protein product [Macrosiphum euphorbiae]|uniref:Uncharacterized protein n=1 Tax=Macrosiphum euphorbiae TaxID=13131 RepID=A0AAV0WUC3_9HEMI|nr:unnamed protein product [Macrosiphum euphorbiae]